MNRSVRTGGDPPAPGARAPGAREEECEFFLRSLRDLEAERSSGDIGEADYQALKDDYTARAAAALRALAGEARQGSTDALHDEDEVGYDDTVPKSAPAASAHRRRRLLITAAAIILVLAGIGWAITGAISARAPGEVISGQAIGQTAVDQHLLAAAKAENHGDAVGAVKQYQAVLKLNPTNPEALTGEGWLLAQTQQPALLRKGLGMLQDAERVAPDYLPAHVYRGIALLSEGDNSAAIPELQYYLAHRPDPALRAKVAQALAAAQAAVAAAHS
ncbi:MAG: hypothetical protein ACYC1D_15450 [Acidimicrobiales bacterium]